MSLVFTTALFNATLVQLTRRFDANKRTLENYNFTVIYHYCLAKRNLCYILVQLKIDQNCMNAFKLLRYGSLL